ncbi:MAG: 50S ribosomal protein L3 N(5)-glutamine methyltransferase, partial [Steroidobacteraceae bacterium]
LARAQLHFGHGTDNAGDEAAALLWHACGLSHQSSARALKRGLRAAERQRLELLVRRRVQERVPLAYLTGYTWFAGLKFHVDPRVLIPRSPIAELIERQFAPWIEAQRVRRIADIGTGSGCIAIACARAFPRAQVDAVDIDPAALAVAERNIRAHRLQRRVRGVLSDHFAALRGRAYDIIVSNPPYVGRREMAALPAEYRHEPRHALAAGSAGLDSVRVILGEAARHLRAGGILILEVGNTERAVRRHYPHWPFTWLQFARGGGGVLMLTREQLEAVAQQRTRA